MLRLLLILLASPLVLGSNEFGVKFLEDNAKRDGVISLPSGLQYKVLRTGDGDSHPTADSSCECHYEGRTAENYPSGEKFDSSYDRGSPTSFAPNQVIKGWTEAMQLMVEGDKWEMFIPSDLGYGDRGRPPKSAPRPMCIALAASRARRPPTAPCAAPPAPSLCPSRSHGRRRDDLHDGDPQDQGQQGDPLPQAPLKGRPLVRAEGQGRRRDGATTRICNST